ncbi:MAG: metal-dependent transcriptional regulator [bacterium]|nr:metal-dependent transcriptional regulator [bacterium]
MKISERAEEILETLWVRSEEKAEQVGLGVARGNPEVEELVKAGLATVRGDRIALTERGRAEGEKVTRRHRLAERFLSDLLHVKERLVHPVGCRFEHLLVEGIEDNICALLGHPRTCPHGRPIPEGECCRRFREGAGKGVMALAAMEAGQGGRVAYIQTRDRSRLQKIMAMGVLPGMPITLIQTFPSYVFQVGQSQFAVDERLAEGIIVRTAAR